MTHVDKPAIARYINAFDFGSVFTLAPTGEIADRRDLHAPTVWHDDELDVIIEGRGWTALTGMTGQYSYNGAVMHSSEYIGVGIIDRLLDLADDDTQTFTIVTVEVLDDPEHPAGWAILHYTGEE